VTSDSLKGDIADANALLRRLSASKLGDPGGSLSAERDALVAAIEGGDQTQANTAGQALAADCDRRGN
jgi:hypothetical protein